MILAAMQSAALSMAMPALSPKPVAGSHPIVMSERVPVSKAEWQDRWPFSIDSGTLICIEFAGQRHVFFSEDLPVVGGLEPKRSGRMVAVSANPFVLFGTEDKDLYLPFDSLETLIKRMGPIEAFGTLLCEKAKQSPEPEL